MRLPCVPLFWATTIIFALHAAAPAQHAIVINEIHYNPDVKTEPAEFIELYNAGANQVDLGGWYFSDGIDYVFPTTNVPAGGFVVVAQNPTVFATKFGIPGALGPFNTNRSSQLDKFGEQIVLRDRLGSVADEVTYQLGFPWPTVGDAPGYSIELINPHLDNDLGGSWRSSVSDGGSPSNSQTLIPGNSTWRYVKGTGEASTPTTAWRHPNFIDTTWLSGPAPIGYGESFIATALPDMSTSYNSVFLRKTFVVDDVAAISSLLMEVLYDDGFKIWINGIHLRSAGLPESEVPYNTFVATAREDLTYNLFTISNPQSYLVPGINTIAIQAHNAASSTDFFIDLRLHAQTGPATRGPTPGRINSAFVTNGPPQIRQVDHTPKEPRSGQPVIISAKATDPDGVATVTLHYQVVDPGAYIELTDAAYTNSWVTVPMNDAGTNGDAMALDAVYSASMPPAIQAHRRLIRYRITVADRIGKSVRVPYSDDPQPNFAYFVYDGVPSWRGAVQPGAAGTNGQVVTFPSNVMGRLPTYHLVGRSNTIATATWFNRYTGDAYPWVGTLVYDGRVYDHIRYRARGGVWRYSMVKNMWKFDFNRGHDFEARDNWGNKYDVPWRKLNLGACIQQGNFDHRGEQGMFESVGFRLFNLAGVESPHSTFATLRVIDDASEADPTSQYEGDFWGIYLAIEQEDGRFLEQHELPDGNLYKMEAGTGDLNNTGPNGPTDKSDLNYFLQNYTGATEQWWRTNLNIGKYVSYQAMVQAIHHYDICYDKNFFYYRNPDTRLWEVLSWDFDLTWADNMYDAGCGGKDRIYPRVFEEASPSKAGIQMAYRNRVREVRDLLWNTNQAWALIDEYAALLRGPANGSTILDADRSMWDYNPKMSSSVYTPNPSDKAGVGRFYQFPRESATNTALRGSFNALVQIMKNYVSIRGAFLDNIANDAARPNRPAITYTGPSTHPINRLTFRCSVFSTPTTTNTFGSVRWRVGEITDTNSPSFNPAAPRKYEIETVWDSGPIAPFAPDITIPANVLRAGSRYRVRAQFTDNTGRNSNWSLPIEFTCGEPETAAELIRYLRITEVMYNPGFGGYEFVELHNSSATLTLDLTGVKFTQGIDYTFPAGTSLPPGGYLLLVNTSDFAAFRAYYGIDASVPIVGPYSGALNNAGEQVTLRTAAGGTDIVSFTYNDGRGWPAADGTGHSMVLLDGAETAQNAGSGEFGGNWRSSTHLKGSPGRGELHIGPSIVLNEVVSNTGTNDLSSNDWIELYNVTDAPLTLGAGWFLSDDSSILAKWMIPAGTVIPAHGWISFDEQTGFHNPTNIGFALSKGGEQVFLSYLPGTPEDRVVDSIVFKAQDETRSLGRFPDGTATWYALPQRTRDASNAAPELGIVISEIMYHPPDIGGTNDNSLDEFIELHNPTSFPVALSSTNGPWRLDGIGFVLPDNLVLGAGEFLVVVNFDPGTNATQLTVFKTAYGLNETVSFIGPYAGKLANSSERLSLEAPQATDTAGEFSWIIVDEVIYADQAPWPCGSDGTGASLHRVSASGHGSDPANWTAQSPTPGSARANEPAGAPTITTHPADRVVATNTTVSFTVAVCGTPPFAYQWQFGETPIPAATNATLTLTNAQLSQSGEYRVLVSNNAGATLSRAAMLIVQLPPIVTEHPESRTVLAGQTAVLSVFAQGTPPFSYQWLFHGSNIVGATDRVLVLTNVLASHAGVYSVIVQNSAAAVLSSNAVLTVNVPPFIITQPQNVSTNPGATVTFGVIAEGSAPLRYQWQFEGANLSGQTNATLALTNVQLDTHGGAYSVYITNQFGSVLSALARLTVLVRPTFTQHPAPVTAAVGDDVAFTAVVAGTRPHTFRWRKGNTFLANGIFTLNTSHCTLAIPNVQPADAATYSVFVTNAAGNSGLGVIAPLVVVVPPANRTAQPGADVSFQVSAFGPAPIRYQWRFNGDDIAEATNAVLTLTNVGSLHRGVYSAVVINSSNMPTAFSAVLNVSLPDGDGDGIPDEWEQAHGLNPDEAADADGDADGDRMTNWQEYIAGTDPRDPQSQFRIDYIGAQSASNGVTLTFQAITNRSYTLEASDTLSSNGWIRLRDIQPSGISNRTIHLYDGGSSLNRAYRITIPGQ